MRKRSPLEIDILAEYFRRALQRPGGSRDYIANQVHRLLYLLHGNTPQPEAGRYSLAMQATRDGIVRRRAKPKEAMNA